MLIGGASGERLHEIQGFWSEATRCAGLVVRTNPQYYERSYLILNEYSSTNKGRHRRFAATNNSDDITFLEQVVYSEQLCCWNIRQSGCKYNLGLSLTK